MAAHGSVGRVVTAGAVGRRPPNGCTGPRAFTLVDSFTGSRATGEPIVGRHLLLAKEMGKFVAVASR
jgi:hypothetical protein